MATRRSHRTTEYRQMYVYGNTVRQPEAMPKRREEIRQPKRRVSSQVRKNRNRARQISPAYVMFFAVAAICAVFVCVQYLQLKAELQTRSENITALQEELSSLTEENDTAYHAAENSVNIQELRDKAINELGMVAPSAGQVIEYESPTSDYVKQYGNIPKSGAIAQSADVSK